MPDGTIDDDATTAYRLEAIALLEAFEFELCEECGRDADAHVIAPDPLGKPHLYCRAVPAGDQASDQASDDGGPTCQHCGTAIHRTTRDGATFWADDQQRVTCMGKPNASTYEPFRLHEPTGDPADDGACVRCGRPVDGYDSRGRRLCHDCDHQTHTLDVLRRVRATVHAVRVAPMPHWGVMTLDQADELHALTRDVRHWLDEIDGEVSGSDDPAAYGSDDDPADVRDLPLYVGDPNVTVTDPTLDDTGRFAVRRTPHLGERAACRYCATDIEWNGDAWWDRGGNTACLPGSDPDTGARVERTTSHVPYTGDDA